MNDILTPEFAQHLFVMLKQFVKGEHGIAWDSLFENKEKLGDLHEILYHLKHNVALADGINDTQKEQVIGKLSIAMSQLFSVETKEEFVKAGKAVEQATRGILGAGDLLLHAEKRYADYISFEKSLALQEKPRVGLTQELANLRVVFVALDALALLGIDKKAH